MRILASKTAILAFSPIGLSFKHDKSMPPKLSNPTTDNIGLKQKRESMCVQPNLKEKNNASVKMNKSVNKSAKLNFGGFFNANKLYSSYSFKKGLEFAADNGALFAAAVALLTTVVLRPFTILSTPGVKKENKEYACAQSIASGAIGFGIMAAISTPIAHAIKKINKNPEKYLKETTIQNLSDGKEILKSSKYKFSTQLFKIGTDFASAIPKALLTCALIPPIMMLLFPKKGENKNYQSVYFKSGSIDNKSKQLFRGFINKG